jgi:hypothetical protein
MKQIWVKNAGRTVILAGLLLIQYAVFGQDNKVEINKETVSAWFEKNWIWVAGGFIVLLLIVLLSGRRRRRTTTVVRDQVGDVKTVSTTVVKDQYGNVKSVSTTEIRE